MREVRLAKAAAAELQRQLDEERRMQRMETMEKRRGRQTAAQLSDEVVGAAVRMLTDKVTSRYHAISRWHCSLVVSVLD